jgi:hypothetical protein
MPYRASIVSIGIATLDSYLVGEHGFQDEISYFSLSPY